jgi:hypothetical protein
MTNIDSVGKPVKDLDKEDKCPVCDRGTNPTPGQTPKYVEENRVPIDKETLIGRENLVKVKNKGPKGAKVYRRGDNLVHRDTMHMGKDAEIEVYNKNGTEHLGAICAHCGRQKQGKKDKKKKCDP